MEMQRITTAIPTGKENAIHLTDLSNVLELTPLETKAAVRNARKDGALICSGIKGYYYAQNEVERNEYLRLMQIQAASRLETIEFYLNAERKGKTNGF